MKDINEDILKAVSFATTGIQGGGGKNDEIIINITNITEDSREKIIDEIIRTINCLK